MAMIAYICDTTIFVLYIEMACIIGLNAVSVMCILSSKFLTPIHALIINLAIVDCLYSSIIPFYVRQFKQVKGEKIIQRKNGCRLSYFLDVMCMIVSDQIRCRIF